MSIKLRIRILIRTKILFSVGGLGNQLFVLNFAHVLVTQQKCKVVIFKNWHSRAPDRPFELDQVLISCKHDIKVIDNAVIYNFCQLLIQICNKLRFYKLKTGYFIDAKNSSCTTFNSYTLFVGYYQNTLQFPIHRDFLNELSNTINNIVLDNSLSAMLSKPFQCAHLRRGDYMSHKETFGVLATSYFTNQILPDLPCVLASEEEPKFFQDFFALANEIMVLPENLSAWQLLHIFSKAEYFFGSNSTLSFWSAIIVSLNKSFSSLPNEWFRNNPTYMPNLYYKGISYVQSVWITC